MKTIAIYCRTLDLGDDPFESEHYWDAYEDLLLALKDRGVAAYFVAGSDSYKGNGRFTAGYTLDAKTTPDKMTKVEDITADLVFDRGDFAGRDVAMVNPASMHKVGSSKIEIYKSFPEFQPFSVICNNKEELAKAFAQIKGEQVVVKEPEGFGGNLVYIGTREEVAAKVADDRYPVLAQTFMDTSVGIPGIVDGPHDFRMTVCGGELIGCFLRTPKEGEYRSNVSKGGTLVYLPVDSIPPAAAEIAHKIDTLFAAKPRYYSVDVGNTPDGWKVIEVDSYLGLHPIVEDPSLDYTMNKLADYLVKVCNDGSARPTA